MQDYREFLKAKTSESESSGIRFTPHKALFDFQSSLVEWALNRGRAAIFADCGLGKTLMQMVWADHIVKHTNQPVLIMTPLAVCHQTVDEGRKFDIEIRHTETIDGPGIYVTNYERLHHYNAADFVGTVCDESSILKSFDGVRRAAITEFMRKQSYRLLCTATAAPNDYIELGTSSEALGYLGHVDMLGRFFVSDTKTIDTRTPWRTHRRPMGDGRWRLKGHAEEPFWKWVASWARALRRPSDLGYSDDRFVLPALVEREHIVEPERPRDGMLFSLPAVGLHEQRKERRHTIQERCEQAAERAIHDKPVVMWCQLNDEGDLLERLVPDAIQVSGRDDDKQKTMKLTEFSRGAVRALVTKPVIGAWGLNWQHCSHVTFFASHSFEQYYQGVRRCWRFGQESPVVVDLILSEGERSVMKNLRRKAEQSDRMFTNLVAHMNQAIEISTAREFHENERKPGWLSRSR